MVRATFSVPTMDCENCSRAIVRGVGRLPGVERVEVDLPARRVVAEYDPQQTSAGVVRGRLEQIGFPPEGELAAPRGPDERQAPPSHAGVSPGSAQSFWYWLLALGVVVLALGGYVGYVLYPRFGLPAAQGAALLLLATGAGIASFFSPCSFPLLVTLLARGGGSEVARAPGGARMRRILSFAAALAGGAALFLLLVGIAIALGGNALFSGVTFTSTPGRVIRGVVGLILIGLGLVQVGFLPFSFHAVEHVSAPLVRSQARYRRRSPYSGFIVLGFGYVLAGFG